MYEELMKVALELGEHVDTEWAEENSAQYDEFADRIEDAWNRGKISDDEFNELALVAFYDYPNGLKGE